MYIIRWYVTKHPGLNKIRDICYSLQILLVVYESVLAKEVVAKCFSCRLFLIFKQNVNHIYQKLEQKQQQKQTNQNRLPSFKKTPLYV